MWSIVLCTLSLAYPLVAAHRAATRDALERWRAYLVCFGLVVLPVLVWPWWIPLRAEFVFLATLFLGAHDARGAHALYARYVAPALAPWTEREVPIHSWDDLFAAMEAFVVGFRRGTTDQGNDQGADEDADEGNDEGNDDTTDEGTEEGNDEDECNNADGGKDDTTDEGNDADKGKDEDETEEIVVPQAAS